MNISAKNKTKNTGFTIVELLIVIVVIGILAAITIVAYSGIQNRANDSAVQSDLSAMAKKIALFHVDNGRYPNTTGELNTLGIKASFSAYSTSPAYNLPYCIASDSSYYAISALSKSGNKYYYSSKVGVVKSYSSSLANDGMQSASSSCADIEAGTARSFIAGYGSSAWRVWVGGTA